MPFQLGAGWPDAASGMDPDRLTEDVVMEDRGNDEERRPEKHFTIAVDFGTTFSSVAFVALEPSNKSRRIEPEHVESVDEYPDAPSDNYDERKEVPTEILYPAHGNRKQPIKRTRARAREDDGSGNGGSESPTEAQESDPENEDDFGDEADLLNIQDAVWGYGVQELLQYPDRDCDFSRHMARFKLMLDTGANTEHIRSELRKKLEILKEKGLVKDEMDVITDFLQRLFQHAKKRLEASNLGFHDSSPVEFVLCVPAIWTGKACRQMQTAMANAIKKSNFVKLAKGSLDNLFIVSEPEAAAACVLARSNDIDPSDTFILLDAGGGTVDAITYTVRDTYPLRLKAEAVKPGGELCGSSYLNERFQAILLRRLKDETYLEQNGRTIKRIVDSEVIKFENQTKRRLDIGNPRRNDTVVYIQDLRADNAKGFQTSRLLLTRHEIEEIFRPSFDGVAQVMLEQIILAKEEGLDPKKVLLIGGFAGCRSLRRYLERVLSENVETFARHVELITPTSLPEMAVARGAVIRALRKEDGPDRIIQSSYGFLQAEPYDPDGVPEHRGARWKIDDIDGYAYVIRTINWLIKKDSKVPSGQTYSLPVSHVFAVKSPKLLCREVLYVLDEKGESHYKASHPKNQGAEIAGRIVVDMTFLKTEGHIQPTMPEIKGQGRKHYRVDFQLVMIVDGRNLRYEARWPDVNGEVQGSAQICIAAAFVPGTA